MNAEIIAIGSELLTPFRQDTNSLYLTRRLNEFGIEVQFKTIVGDRKQHLVETARLAISRSEIVFFIGGLGPTEDDLTRESVAEALGVGLRRDHDVVAELYARFAARRIKMPENNARQADAIEGAFLLKNDRGTAPGQMWEGDVGGARRIVFLLPGPPHELEAMYEQQVKPRLKDRVPQLHLATRELRIAMVAESLADQRAAAIYKQYPDVQTTILASPGEVQFQLRAQSHSIEKAETRIEELSTRLEEEFADEVYSTSGERLEQIVGYYLQMRGMTIAVAESCTGGLLSQRLTSVSGSSRYFLGGAIVYSNDMKTLFADVPPLMIAENGAVSKPVAIALAEGIRKRCRAKMGVGITGVAGPTGGTDAKPVGTVFVSVADGTRTETIERKFPGDRDRIRWWATQLAMDMIRKKLI